MNARERVLLVSDLHMATPGGPFPDPFGHDLAFARALDDFARSPLRTRLVLLGDIVDFLLAAPAARPAAGPVDLAVAKLDAIAGAHRGVFDAIARFARAGHHVEIVPGNHDRELLLAPVQQRFTELLGDVSVSWSPWFVHVPGVLYAEHGQQHNDLNHIARLLDAAGAPAAPAACLDSLRIELARMRGVGPEQVAFAAAAGSCRLARSLLTVAFASGCDADYERRLRMHAEEAGLPGDTLVALHCAAVPRLRAIARRVGGLAMARVRRSCQGTSDSYLVEAARAIDTQLRAAGTAPPFYVFGHSHVAGSRRLGGKPSARYLNGGAGLEQLRFIEIEHDGGLPPVARMHWKPDRLPLRAWVAAAA